MGLLQRIFGRKNKALSSLVKKESKSDISYSGSFVEIRSLSYFGQYRKSPSEEWLLSWSDSDRKNLRGGYRESGHGSYILYNLFQNKLVAKGELERPNNGYVADNGYFSLEDWQFGGGLKGTFLVFSLSQEKLIKKHFSANIYNSGLSDNAKIAVCQTANAQNSDGSLFCAFDMMNQKELFSIHPPTGWANSYEFEEENFHVVAVLNGIGKFRYDRNGNFIDAEAYEAARLTSERYDVILSAVGNAFKGDLTHKEIQAILLSISKAKLLGATKDRNWKAMAMRYEGMAYEKMGDIQRALAAYREALEANPKIGLKRKVSELQKKI